MSPEWISRKEIAEMAGLLRARGYDPDAAKRLSDEGIGPYELEERLKIPPGGMGSLDYTHGIKHQSHRRSSIKRKRSYTTRSTATRKRKHRVAKRRTITRLRRVRMAAKRRGWGVLRHSKVNPFGSAREPWGSWYEKVKRNAGPKYQAFSQKTWEQSWRSGASPGEAVEEVLNEFHRAWPYP